MVWGLYWIWRKFKVKADFRGSMKIFASSTLSAVATYLALNGFASVLTDWYALIVGVIVFVAVYLISAPLLGAINQADVDNFRAMFSNIGVVSKLLEIPLRIIEQPLKLRGRQPAEE